MFFFYHTPMFSASPSSEGRPHSAQVREYRLKLHRTVSHPSSPFADERLSIAPLCGTSAQHRRKGETPLHRQCPPILETVPRALQCFAGLIIEALPLDLLF